MTYETDWRKAHGVEDPDCGDRAMLWFGIVGQLALLVFLLLAVMR